MSEVQAEEEKKPFIGFLVDAECCCFSCNDFFCTPIMDESLKEKGYCCTICSGANYLVKPSIFCAAREALCGYPKFAVAGSPQVKYFDYGNVRLCGAFLCGLAALSCQPGCFGCSTEFSLLFLEAEAECLTPTQDEKMTAQGRCCTICVSKCSCTRIESCVDCRLHQFCLELHCSLPCKQDVPCAFGCLGLLCCYKWKVRGARLALVAIASTERSCLSPSKCLPKCCPKPVDLDPELLGPAGKMEQTANEMHGAAGAPPAAENTCDAAEAVEPMERA